MKKTAKIVVADICLFAAAAAFVLITASFTYGFLLGKFQFAPYKSINALSNIVQSYIDFGRFSPKNRLVFAPEASSLERWTMHRPSLMLDGFYVILGWDEHDERYTAWLYDEYGHKLHSWGIDYTSLDADGPLNGSDSPHGLAVLRDGSIIVNFDGGDVMSRLDECSDPIWNKDGVYHHSLHEAEDGTFWTWRGEGSSFSQYQYMVNFDPITGKTLKEIGLIEDLITSRGSSAAIFQIRPDHKFAHFLKNPDTVDDIFHPNDIETLHSSLAPNFPQFEAGDLMISLKMSNLIMILDPDDLIIKWWSNGPWKWQHDPDFTNDGKISVYNNNPFHERSEILTIDPVPRKIGNAFLQGDLNFYSQSMGKHQYLPNGNVLVVIPGEGRLVVVSSEGDKVMEFNNIAGENSKVNGHVENGIWLPINYFDSIPECSALTP